MEGKFLLSKFGMSRVLLVLAIAGLAGCAGSNNNEYMMAETPAVDYVESLDVYSAPHKDSFLNQLAMNYRSYAIYNARTSGYTEMGELFAQKAIAAFSGELPFPEVLDNWPVADEQESFELYTAYNELLDQLKNDASMTNPQLAAEAQAKFDCWLSAAASGQTGTANECRNRFQKTMTALRDCEGGKIVSNTTTETKETVVMTSGDVSVAVEQQNSAPVVANTQTYYPETRNLSQMRGTGKAREGVIIVNNVNVPENLINPVPVQQPLVFNQNIYGGDKTKTISNSNNDNSKVECVKEGDVNCTPQVTEQQRTIVQQEIPTVSEELVTREEFINMMMAMRAELQAINARLDQLQTATGDKTIIKVQQIPLEPKQQVMEEVFEVRFDFDKAVIKPEYEDLIRQLATATQNNKNIKVSVVGHTDTVGSADYNYALGGRRAEAVQKMLIGYGIPASQIVAVSAGEEGLAVQTPDGVPNAANRRARVVKEIHYEEPAQNTPIIVEEYSMQEDGMCGMYGCTE